MERASSWPGFDAMLIEDDLSASWELLGPGIDEAMPDHVHRPTRAQDALERSSLGGSLVAVADAPRLCGPRINIRTDLPRATRLPSAATRLQAAVRMNVTRRRLRRFIGAARAVQRAERKRSRHALEKSALSADSAQATLRGCMRAVVEASARMVTPYACSGGDRCRVYNAVAVLILIFLPTAPLIWHALTGRQSDTHTLDTRLGVAAIHDDNGMDCECMALLAFAVETELQLRREANLNLAKLLLLAEALLTVTLLTTIAAMVGRPGT